jgi:hypothetical protein
LHGDLLQFDILGKENAFLIQRPIFSDKIYFMKKKKKLIFPLGQSTHLAPPIGEQGAFDIP